MFIINGRKVFLSLVLVFLLYGCSGTFEMEQTKNGSNPSIIKTGFGCEGCVISIYSEEHGTIYTRPKPGFLTSNYTGKFRLAPGLYEIHLYAKAHDIRPHSVKGTVYLKAVETYLVKMEGCYFTVIPNRTYVYLINEKQDKILLGEKPRLYMGFIC